MVLIEKRFNSMFLQYESTKISFSYKQELVISQIALCLHRHSYNAEKTIFFFKFFQAKIYFSFVRTLEIEML